ncbi:3-methyladenine DNA glycosylase [Nakamurella endophytica]|uniref:3-methyladenine DNA glycosylase n=1 Tax=Nakamurella endophytica TaxID=1748367 RepID=A0A917WG64_9ACTN|nr:3-methyladenine DNA glycosylase [Nakamurella endophytica]GGM04249.1 hypothetical protein GCM10011594_25580 [Nakamurella endophytica]
MDDGAPSTADAVPLVPGPAWRAMARDHGAAVDELTAGIRARRGTGATHPVEDFLFTYYRLRPGQLRRWQPGPGVGLLDAGDLARREYHRPVTVATDGGPVTAVVVDTAGYLADHRVAVEALGRLLRATAERPASFGCFGLHEWAMVYDDAGARRHARWPLRLGAAGTDAVVRSQTVRCSHHDAFRFFTPAARPRNTLRPTAQDRVALEQPGCLHASMDLYKWTYKLGPLVSADLVLRCFRLALRIRYLDMQASPYDLSALGVAPVPIETPAGRAAYVRAQREVAARAAVLRAALRRAVERALTAPR